jgi:hypothetical protein
MTLPLIRFVHRSYISGLSQLHLAKLQALGDGTFSHFPNKKEPHLTVLTKVKSTISSEKSYLEAKLIL